MLPFMLSVVTLILVGYIVWPALKGVRTRWEFSDEDTPLGRLAVRKDVLVGNIADLDFEFAMGKVSEVDHRELREGLKNQTLRIMEQMDVLATGQSSGNEAALDKTLEGLCGNCRGEIPSAARFCPHCGSPTGGHS